MSTEDQQPGLSDAAGLSLRELDKIFHARVKARLYIIRNGRTTPEPSIVKATLPDIAEKAVSSLVKTADIGDLYRYTRSPSVTASTTAS